uniref:Putative secreted protein n=1 Tax=Amblyomma aureolatum TaxID=187763 RepID=A0A1E1X183_9ACAR
MRVTVACLLVLTTFMLILDVAHLTKESPNAPKCSGPCNPLDDKCPDGCECLVFKGTVGNARGGNRLRPNCFCAEPRISNSPSS